MDAYNFIKKRPYLIWHVKDYKHLSMESIVENVINFGDFDDIKKLFFILGINKAASIFYKQLRRKRINYDPKIANYFKAYFKKYAKTSR